VKLDNIVRGRSGLIGRISEVSENYSTVLLVSDHNSRIPVVASTSKVKGIIARQGDDLKIIHLEEDHNLAVGETVYTSGDGKIFPKGIPVATVVRVENNTAFIETIEQFNKIEFVVIESNS
jgi:rod shape-determining protein MreC